MKLELNIADARNLEEVLKTADLVYEKFGPGGAPQTRKFIADLRIRLAALK